MSNVSRKSPGFETCRKHSFTFWDCGHLSVVTSVGSKEGDSAQRGPSPPSCGPDPGGAGPTWGRSVLRRFPPPAARPRSSCITSWAPITRGSWWKASTSARCWSPRCFPRGGCGPRTCWWVGVSDVDPRPFFLGTLRIMGAQWGLWSELGTQLESANSAHSHTNPTDPMHTFKKLVQSWHSSYPVPKLSWSAQDVIDCMAYMMDNYFSQLWGMGRLKSGCQ